MTRADTLDAMASWLGEVAATLDRARGAFELLDMPGSQAEAARLAREVIDLWQATTAAAQTARATEGPRLRVVPPGTPSRLYGEGYSPFDERTESARRVDREIRNSNHGNNDHGKGQG